MKTRDNGKEAKLQGKHKKLDIHNYTQYIFGVHVLGLEWATTGLLRPPVDFTLFV